MDIELRQIGVIAGKEFWDRIRNRWVLAVALVFTAFALVIAYFGAAQQGAVGFRSIELTIASLVSLVIYLIPLIALVLGFDAIVGERERVGRPSRARSRHDLFQARARARCRRSGRSGNRRCRKA